MMLESEISGVLSLPSSHCGSIVDKKRQTLEIKKSGRGDGEVTIHTNKTIGKGN
jgi:hypothetical protein